MQKITPNIWFDKEAVEAADFYTSIFPDSKIKSTVTIDGTPSGTATAVTIELAGYELALLAAGPYFKINPSISFLVLCETAEEVNKYYEALKVTELMPLQSYPFSERYAWIKDKYGLTWQIMKCQGGQEITQKIMPSMLFVGDVAGKAEEAMNFYIPLFKDSKIGDLSRYGDAQASEKPESLMYGEFFLEGQKFAAMDSSLKEHNFKFNEALSYIVNCKDQEEVDYFSEKMSFVPEAEQCGWIADKFGVSWQIVPVEMNEMLKNGTKEQKDRVTQAFLKMKRLDIAELKRAYEGK